MTSAGGETVTIRHELAGAGGEESFTAERVTIKTWRGGRVRVNLWRGGRIAEQVIYGPGFRAHRVLT